MGGVHSLPRPSRAHPALPRPEHVRAVAAAALAPRPPGRVADLVPGPARRAAARRRADPPHRVLKARDHHGGGAFRGVDRGGPRGIRGRAARARAGSRVGASLPDLPAARDGAVPGGPQSRSPPERAHPDAARHQGPGGRPPPARGLGTVGRRHDGRAARRLRALHRRGAAGRGGRPSSGTVQRVRSPPG